MIGFLQSSDEEANGGRPHQRAGSRQRIQLRGRFIKFFTLLPDLDACRSLVADAQVAAVREILLKICDLVDLSEFSAQSQTLRDAPNTAVFQFSLTRTAETFFAYKNAGPMLRGGP
ncbi:hypothetical protein [Rhizobium mongolense]|uniref:Uncharacterized protein n=1 Tax=Rhizobium mongolense TaxID=57676 RepID=A0A7W6RPX8_9HYPH|nr:hypothetical protein [Rhizobium mongolense]MBB4276389.1 hypothetical protein [Rhizobium mongolense]